MCITLGSVVIYIYLMCVCVCVLFVTGMMDRKRGAIINIGSAAGAIPTGNPLYAVYSGSKAYIDFFSRSLYQELKSKNVFVQVLTLGFRS